MNCSFLSSVQLSSWRWLRALRLWFDTSAEEATAPHRLKRIDWLRGAPFVAMHLACLAVFFVGWSWTAVAVAAGMYLLRMFAVTGFYHRYFSHRSFKTSRAMQLVFAVLGASAAQRGPLWWASHHRHHHKHSDQEADIHSPRQHGFLWSHMGWIISEGSFATRHEQIPDLTKYPELRFLDRFDVIVPAGLAVGLYLVGEYLAATHPQLATDGWQLVVWGFVISTVVLYHATYTVNSLAHRIGRRRYRTRDDSRNSALIALLTLGEGWHNNHHHFPGSARQGFYWWELDVTYYLLRLLAACGLIWDLKQVPPQVRAARRYDSAQARSARAAP